MGKLETDKIVCASPPEGPGQICKGIFGLDYEKHIKLTDITTDELVPSTFQVQEVDEDAILSEFEEITNASALELYARVKDYSYVTVANVLVVHIAIPAYKFDLVPEAPDLGELNTSVDKIVIKPPEFMQAINKFDATMLSFSKFQSYFYKEENGSLYFQETGDPFYIKFYAETRIKQFVDTLNSLMENNGFHLKGFADTGEKWPGIAFEIEISFDKTDENKPFVVQNVRARKKGCPYVECKKGLSSFIEYSRNDQTMMGYISDIENIGRQLESNKTPPWLDFIVSKTFPQLAVNYGSSANFEDNACLSANLQEAFDFILDEALDLFTSIEYAFNKNRCKTKEEILEERNERTDFFSNSPEAIRAKKNLAKAWTKREEQGDEIYKAAEEGVKAGIKGAQDFASDPGKGVIKLGKAVVSGTMSAGQAVAKFVKEFNACDFKHLLNSALKCLMAGLSLDEVYYTLLKQILSSAGEAAIETILQSLPADKREAIEEKIREEFKDMPFPWEPGWESGSLGKAVDREARSDAEEKQTEQAQAEQDSASLQKRIEDLQKDKSNLQDFLTFGGGDDEEFQSILQELKKARQENTILTQEIERINDTIEEYRSYIEPIDPADLDEEELEEQEENDQNFRDLIKGEEKRKETKQSQIDLNNKIIRDNGKYIEIDPVSGTQIPTQFYVNFIEKELERIEKLIQKLEKKKFKEEKTAEELQVYDDFSSLSPEDQEKVVEMQKKKTILVKTKPTDEIVTGTLGESIGKCSTSINSSIY